ncbi:MAG: ABC transporter substrate-binding protein [Clostridiales bacterium]|nr:ABC transporter substrate-binding protein [Clostridiales bacterium]
MRKTVKLLCLLTALAMLSGLAACGSGGTESSSAGIVMNVAMGGDIIRLDPAFAYDNETSVVVDQIAEGLLGHYPDNSIKCILAESWEAVDPVTYVYTLRQGVNFSDGSPMTAEDVVYSISRHLDESMGSYFNWMFENVESVEKTGEHEVTVRLENPDATWQYVLATSAGMIIKKDYCEEKGDEFGSASGGIIGTGPFVYESWQNGSKVTLKRNENYWDKAAKTNIDKIVFSIITDDTTLLTALKNGQVDFCVSYSNTLNPSISEISNVNLLGQASMEITYLTFNTARAPFDDVNVRRAIACAIDLDKLHDGIIKDTGIKGGPLPMTDTLFTIETQRWKQYAASLPPHEFNLEKARNYLSKSNVSDGFECELITIQDDTLHYNVALVVQEMLKAIDIEVSVHAVGWDEFFAYMFGEEWDENGVRDYDMLVALWGSDYPDPSGNLDPLYSSIGIGEGGSNNASYSNPELDELLAGASASLDPKERVDLLIKACDIIVEDMPYYIFNYPITYVIVSKNYDYGDMAIFSAWDMNFKDMVHVGD